MEVTKVKTGRPQMKLYRKLIKPVLYYPGQSYEPKKKNLENPAVWYPEEEKDALLERFRDLNNTFETVSFDEKYIEYDQEVGDSI